MKIFTKRETLAQNMALMGLMSALNIIIAVASSLVPIVSIFLILILPLISVLVELYCKDRYYPIYAIASFGLSLVATLWNMETTIFYLLPSLIVGYIFGLLAKKRIPSLYSILITSLIQLGLTMLFIPLINFIFDVDMVNFFKTIFKLTESKNIDIIVPSFIFVISLIQMSLSNLIIKEEIKKIGFEEIDEKKQWIYQLILLVDTLAIIGLYFLSLKLAYVFLLIAIYLAVFIIADYIKMKYIWTLIIFAFGLLINVIVFALANEKMANGSSLLLIAITPFWIAFISTIVSFLKRKEGKIK